MAIPCRLCENEQQSGPGSTRVMGWKPDRDSYLISDPEADVFAEQLKQRITQALANLAERQRQVFLLREQLGVSIRDTADILGCSENSVKQHHFRALRAMRAQLSEVWEHERA